MEIELNKRDRAKKLFAKSQKAPLTDQEAERRAIAEKTARLRALRLARDEAEAAAGTAPARNKRRR